MLKNRLIIYVFLIMLLMFSIKNIIAGMIDDFENNSIGLDYTPYTNDLLDNTLGGYWYIADDHNDSFTTASNSRTRYIGTTSDAAGGTSVALVTGYTLGVSSAGANEWAYWGLTCSLSSDDRENNLTGKTLSFYIKGSETFSIKLQLSPTESKASSKYGDDIYGASVNVTTSWQKAVLPIDSNTFSQEGWGTAVPFNSAVTEVVGFTWSHTPPESGARHYYELYIDEVEMTGLSGTTVAVSTQNLMVDKGEIKIFNNLMDFRNGDNPTAKIQFKPSTEIDYVSEALTTIKIFNIKGELILKKNVELKIGEGVDYEWDGRDGSGKKVGTGIYTVVVQIGDIKKSSRIFVIR